MASASSAALGGDSYDVYISYPRAEAAWAERLETDQDDLRSATGPTGSGPALDPDVTAEEHSGSQAEGAHRAPDRLYRRVSPKAR